MGKVKDILSKSSEAEVNTEVSIPYGKGKDNFIAGFGEQVICINPLWER